jgi:flagellar hook-associated protein 3 FlgL
LQVRVTNGTLVRNVLYNIDAKSQRIMELQDQLASGRRITRPSQDPAGTVSAMRLSTALAELEQYLKNINDARGWLEQAEHALNGTIACLQRASELAVQGASGTLRPGDRATLAREAEQIYHSALDLANLKHGENFIFAGQLTSTQPFTSNGEYVGDYGRVLRDVGPGNVVQVNLIGEEVFGGAGGVLDSLQCLAEALAGGDPGTVEACIGRLQGALDSTLARLADVGGRSQRVDFLEQRAQEARIGITAVHSSIADVDLAEVLVHLRAQEAAYQAALGAGARFLQVSLLDFLR